MARKESNLASRPPECDRGAYRAGAEAPAPRRRRSARSPWTSSARARPHRRRDGPAEGLPDPPHRLPRPVLVLDEGEADVVVAVLAEPDPRRHRDLRLLQQELRELERPHRLEGVRDLGPHEHRRLRLRDVPPGAREAVAEHVAAAAVLLADLLDVVLRPVQRVRRGDLERLEDAVVEVALDAGERGDDLAVADREADPPARHVVALRE